MVVVKTSRTKLDEHLAEDDWTLLLLSGAEASAARDVHDMAEHAFSTAQTWRKTLLVTDLDLLTDDERAEYLPDVDRYAFVARRSRRVVRAGDVDELLKSTGEPSIRRIRGGFNEGDAG